MNDLITQLKKLQILNCLKHTEYESPLFQICTDDKCSEYLAILCSECVVAHPKHYLQHIQTFKKVIVQLGELYLKGVKNIDNQNQELLSLAKSFKILSTQCKQISDQIYTIINNLYQNPQEKIKEFEEFINNIQFIQSQDILQRTVQSFRKSIKFENQPKIDFYINNLNDQQKDTYSQQLQNQLTKINQQFFEFQENAIKSLIYFENPLPNIQESLIQNIQQQQLPQALENFLKNNINNYTQSKIIKIEPKFTKDLHHESFTIKDDGKAILHLGKQDINSQYALLQDDLKKYKNQIVFFSVSFVYNCKFAGFGISDFVKSKNKFFQTCNKFSHIMFSDKEVIEFKKKKSDKSGFLLEKKKSYIINYLLDGYKDEFYILNESFNEFVKFSPKLDEGNWTWCVLCLGNSEDEQGELFKIL